MYTAIIQHDGPWWIGWIKEIRGVNSQGATREELLVNLQSALQETLEMNREEAMEGAADDHEEVRIAIEMA
jgi:predicted RNase H-like HicB family nuclease